MKRQQYVTITGSDGFIDYGGIIRKWNDDQHLTIEWIPVLDIDIMLRRGMEPNVNDPIIPENCEDIDLKDGRRYRLHYTWLTVAGTFIRDARRRDRE